MKKIKTGIKGFDRLVGGGFPEERTILLSGTPGTGKTIFALEYIYNGAIKYNEKGLYVSFEENSENLKRQAAIFGWDFNKLEKEGKVKIMDISPKEVKEHTAKDIVNMVKKHNYNRLVVDSLSALAINTPTLGDITNITDVFIRRFLYHFINDLRKTPSTSILISQTKDGQLSRDGVSEFICDGIINIRYEGLGGLYSRNLVIRKMREVNNDEDIHPMEISQKGLVIHDL